MTKKRLVIANWKMYVQAPLEAKKFAQSLRRKTRAFAGVEAAIAPSFTLLPVVAAALKGSSVRVGAQTLSGHEEGAHTGDVSAAMVKAAGGTFSIIGHSERRVTEDNEYVHTQLVRTATNGLAPVLCVGERERSQDGTHFSFIAEQIRSALTGSQSLASKLVVAYEPIWAIGKSSADAMKPEVVRETIIFIRKTLAEVLPREQAMRIPILYGGSVEPENAKELFLEGGVSGFLVGHASAQIDSFVGILQACKK